MNASLNLALWDARDIQPVAWGGGGGEASYLVGESDASWELGVDGKVAEGMGCGIK